MKYNKIKWRKDAINILCDNFFLNNLDVDQFNLKKKILLFGPHKKICL